MTQQRPRRPNLVFVFPDQVRATALPLYGESNIATPHVDRLAREGLTLDNALSTAPVCTPYRSMLMTGRHPQTTGHVINFLRTRWDEIGFGDAFKRAGYRTGYVGKWHLHTGSFPQIDGLDYVPEGRDRLGFDHWRGYNFHTNYFNGSLNLEDWRNEVWEGYETDALARHAKDFISSSTSQQPFCLFVSPHQCHWTPNEFVPEKYYDRLPKRLKLPDGVPEEWQKKSERMYREYLAMLLAVDDMLGEILDHLDATNLADDTIVIFTSDHGTQVGAQGIRPWEKRLPYEASIRVPWVMRWPGAIEPGARRDFLLSPVDIMPSLCRLCDIPIPRTVEGHDLSEAFLGKEGAFEQASVLTMMFSLEPDFLADGWEWRGVRTKRHSYARWRDGRRVLYDIEADPAQLRDLAGDPASQELAAELEADLQRHLRLRADDFPPCTSYASWFDSNRRIIRNAFGPLGNPEDLPDWSLAQEIEARPRA